MKRQMAKVINHGTHRVIWDDQKKFNAYRVTYNGHKVVDYADFTSCLLFIADVVSLEEKGRTPDGRIVMKGVK